MLQGPGGKPQITSNLTRLAGVSAGLPLLVVLLLYVFGILGSPMAGLRLDPDKAEGQKALTDPLRASAQAQSLAVEGRLGRLAYSSKVLAAYAGQILAHPEIYAPTTSQSVPQPQSAGSSPAPSGAASTDAAGAKSDKTKYDSGQAPGAAKSADGTAMPAGAKAKLDNPIMYSKGKDGALRKVMDDGGASVYYRARATGSDFTAYEKQRLYASAALDILLKEAAQGDKLCGQAFVLTNDSLLRTYPYKDLMGLEGDKDLTDTPLFAWSSDKANEDGVVWTSAYFSWISSRWVVACLSPVMLGDRLVAVAGCEVSLKGVEQEVLSFSQGSSNVAWLQRPDGMLLAASTGGEQLLGVRALSGADVPNEQNPAKKITDEANILQNHRAIFADLLDEAVKSDSALLRPYGDKGAGKYLATIPLPGQQWIMGVTLESPIARQLYQSRLTASKAGLRGGLILLAVLVGAALLSWLLAWIEARRITRPLKVLTQKGREIARSGHVMPLALAEEGEIGELSRAFQDAADSLIRSSAESEAAQAAQGPADPARNDAP